MSTQKKLITLCLGAVFTLGLAACGGGGGGDAPAPSMMDGDVSLEGKYIPSGTEIRGVDAPNGTTLTAANGVEVTIPGVGTVECASEGGCSGTVVDGVVTITGDLKIVSVDPDLDSDTAMLLAGLAVDMLPTESEPAGGITLDAMAVAGAIGPSAGPATVPPALMIMNGVPGAMSPLEASDAVDAAAISGWNASVTQRMTEEIGAIKASTDTVIIYNDQDSRARPMFAVRHILDVSTDTNADDFEAWRITDERVSMVSGVEDFPSAVNQMAVPFDADTTYRGMFDGAPGTYACVATACTLSTGADGKLSAVGGGTWRFTPDEDATVDPNDYLRFGFWLNESTDDEGGPAYTVAAFYGGSADPASADANAIQAVVGTASYSGSATGLYMRKTFAENGDPIPQEGGQFTADANLDANFSGADVSANAKHTVTGMITNFMDGGNAIPGGWALELMKASFGIDVSYENYGTFTGKTRRDADTAADGKIGPPASLVTLRPTKPTDVVEEDMPTGIAGEFTGHFNTGHVLGAFGAEMD